MTALRPVGVAVLLALGQLALLAAAQATLGAWAVPAVAAALAVGLGRLAKTRGGYWGESA